MRKVIVSNIMSDDGYYDGPDADLQGAVDLALLEARRFDGSSNVLLRYGVG
jgi:hypothetical protein